MAEKQIDGTHDGRKASGENSIVRDNLLTRPDYTPYCGNSKCNRNMPRTYFVETVGQFKCHCGWKSQFPADFIQKYKTAQSSLKEQAS